MLTAAEKSIVFGSLLGEYHEWFYGSKQRQAEIESICGALGIVTAFP